MILGVEPECVDDVLPRGVPEGGDAVDVSRLQTGVGDCSARGVQGQLQTGDARATADVGDADPTDDRVLLEQLRSHRRAPWLLRK